MKQLNDELQIHISVKWAIQIIMFVVTLTGAYYTIHGKVAQNKAELQYVKDNLVEFEEMLEARISRLERYKEQELEEVNKSLLSKVLGGKDE
jgi:hypothetical protein|tara:strand:- start:255 stop:530 length:276 start_codon:yes stop_codon:yes gene_type:complete